MEIPSEPKTTISVFTNMPSLLIGPQEATQWPICLLLPDPYSIKVWPSKISHQSSDSEEAKS